MYDKQQYTVCQWYKILICCCNILYDVLVRLHYICRSLERFIYTKRDYVSKNNLYFRSTVSLPQQLLMSYLLSLYLWVFEIRRLILTHLVHLENSSSLQSQHSVVICWNIVSVECIIQFGNYKGERDFSGKYHEVY